jgi:hypothetical protein
MDGIPWRTVYAIGYADVNKPCIRAARKETSDTNRGTRMAYHLEGRLLEVCDCRVLCPCWIGEDPDNGTCESVLAYHFDAGAIEGVDVSAAVLNANES